MTRNRSIFGLCGLLANRRSLEDRANTAAHLAAIRSSVAHRATATQVRKELFCQHFSGLDKETAVNCLVRHTPTVIVAKLSFKPYGNLLRRPVQAQLLRHHPCQGRVLRQVAWLGALRIGAKSAIAALTAVTSNLPTDA